MSAAKVVHLIGYASDLAGANQGAAQGPLVMRNSSFLNEIMDKTDLIWDEILTVTQPDDYPKLTAIGELCQQLALKVNHLLEHNKFFTVLGGDHSCAIGTWSGAFNAIKDQGPLGLIWIDAHMDSHTPHTSLSGNVHGMPLASLFGFGLASLIYILNSEPKLKPENVCLIGVRSFERGEAALLKELNVRVFFMEEIKERGLKVIMQEALERVTCNTAGFGVSIDIDSLDPMDAPGTGVAESNGLRATDLLSALESISEHPKLIGAEIVEFDPTRDLNHKTEKLIACMLGILAAGKKYREIFTSCCTRTADAVV